MKKILIQLDTDSLPGTFDRVVAIDAGVDELLTCGGVTVENVVPLVHGAIFTRGPNQLKHTALFVGGSDVSAGEDVFRTVQSTFFGPMRVSVLMDSNGSSTTAAAAVLAAAKHLDLSQTTAVVAGGTGPVGQRVARLLAGRGATVRLASRSAERAEAACEPIRKAVDGAQLEGVATGDADSLLKACQGCHLLVAAGAAGVQFLSQEQWSAVYGLQVAIDLNAVPPLGLAGIEVSDRGTERNGLVCYGAIGVGGTKMKIHKAAIQALFESNDRILDVEAVYAIGEQLQQG
ncbi:MAG: bifunctional NADP-dependent methylenetetrahydromethanopterin dehydrogenase/methylenetetrahydrofolate dehydrogenase [Planctomycetaceae bacterium]|nr:bifunctional NADP-dependent methylenetetrahydromethanopterin dehydrogenase/methylenetetrahydrofolate dehydrogenase [Planctomycetaceae bacterium]